MGVSLGQCGPHPAVATLPAILSPLPPISPASDFSQWGVLEGLLGVTVKQRPKGGALEGLMARPPLWRTFPALLDPEF